MSVQELHVSLEKHHFESKADAAVFKDRPCKIDRLQFVSKDDAEAGKTYSQWAGTICKNGYIVIKDRPCKVLDVIPVKTGKPGRDKYGFVGLDIFTRKKLQVVVPSSLCCDVPHVKCSDYQLINISEDGFVSLLTESGGTKDDLRLPTDEGLLTLIKDRLAEGKDLVVSVICAMGEEGICKVTELGSK
ncbi:eukaryotic translation initiation factor 5A-2 [Iris pallida]|uniref:Eukaryotic translation initiation factor 5A-2 n=1 Tax=Iris pallida TaxID=29817 RepID=A0AAX6EGF8_IRIPA|nr:eukaryotic translation initiation factor 5A-2 [Iris pallida]KAJ6808517.1 eukaryotic translation initiation factor 5A-2 [Iris pallida]